MPDNHSHVSSVEYARCLQLLEKLRQTISDVYGDEVWTAVKTGMAVIGSLSFSGLSNPITLLYEGGSGRGKSTIINILSPDREDTKHFVYRLDNFTPKSFVSHAANVSQDKIGKIDLLPQLKDKTLLVKELAPLFRGREDELRANFAMLTAVLDGKGYMSASGVHGTRGYDGEYVFNWLGATTPVPAKTDAIMAQLGNRMLRYEIVGKEQSEEELIEFAQSYEPATEEKACRAAANNFLNAYFAVCKPRTIDPTSIAICKSALSALVRFTRLITQGRVEITKCQSGNNYFHEDEAEDVIVGKAEGPHRIILYLRTIAQGLALINGRTEVNADDLEIIRHIAFSSITGTRREMLRAVLLDGGVLESKKASEILGVSLPTARSRMRELAATGIVCREAGQGNVGESISLATEWGWLLTTEDMDEPVPEAELAPAETRVPLWVVEVPFRLGAPV